MFFLFCCVSLVILFCVSLLAMVSKNRFEVEHSDRQRIVIRNIVDGNLRILSQGTHYCAPWWIQDIVVDLNKLPTNTGENGHHALASDSVELLVRARYNVLAGRTFHDDTGQLISGDDTIEDSSVLLAVTKTDFNKRKEYVEDVFAAAVEAVIGEFTGDELLLVSEDDVNVQVPKCERDLNNGGYVLAAQVVDNKRELLIRLSEYIQRETNYRLRFVGYNVDEVAVQDLRARDPQVQESHDRRQRVKNIMRASLEYKDADISDREKLASPDQQGAVAAAEANRDSARMFSASITRIAAAMEQAAQSFNK